MDERCDYVQKFLEEWELQNRIFKAMAPYHVYLTGFLILKEEENYEKEEPSL